MVRRGFQLSRRRVLGGGAAGLAALGAVTQAPRKASAEEKTVKIGFLAPLTGEVAAWGLPGLYGCQIWAEHVNAAGGLAIGGDQYMVELVPYDNEYLADKASVGMTQLVFEDGVKFVMMLGGDTMPAALPSPRRPTCWSRPCCPAT
ncbi:MAG: ABC transporter substrate-binding protein [Alphaproteobacteria bacterium]